MNNRLFALIALALLLALGLQAQVPRATDTLTISTKLVLPAKADPGTPTAQELWLSTTTANTLKYRSGGTTYTLATTADLIAGYQPLDADLTSIAGNTTGGFLTRTASNTYTARTITGTAGQITVTNGDGVSGAPTLSLPTALSAINSITSATGSALTLATLDSNANLILDPHGTGVVSTLDPFVSTDNTSYRTWQGVSTQQARGYLTQREGNQAGFYALTVGTSAGSQFIMARARGSFATQTAVQSLDVLGSFFAQGHDGSSISGAPGTIVFYATENWTGSAKGTRVDIGTTITGSTTAATASFIDGNLLLNTTSLTGLTGAGGLKLASTTDSSSTTTGSLITAGGLGVAKNIYGGAKLQVSASAGTFTTGITNYHNLSVTGDGNSDGTTDLRGVFSTIATTGSNNVANLTAYRVLASNDMSSGTLASAIALSMTTRSTSGAATTSANVFSASHTISGAGNTTSWAGYLVASPTYSSTGRITNPFGIYVSDIGAAGSTEVTAVSILNQTKGSGNLYGIRSQVSAASGKWNLYLDGTAQNYLAGELGVGVAASSTTQLVTAASTTGKSSLRIPHGAAPTSPVDGDMWTTTAGLYVRINGATVGPLN